VAQVKKIILLSAAEAELLDAVAFYNEQSEGLGFEFAAEVHRTIQRIIRYPAAFRADRDSLDRPILAAS
jgi:hypothetical protein